MTENEKLTMIIAIMSIVVSLFAIYISQKNSEQSNKIAEEALKISRQSNEISLGLKKEFPIIEIINRNTEFDFTKSDILNQELVNIIQIRNIGKIPINAISLEIIGIVPFTYPMNDPKKIIKPLPSKTINIKLKTMLRPSDLASIDLNQPIIQYLAKLNIEDKSTVYNTMLNIVLSPKSINENTPSGISPDDTLNDRILITIKFKHSILSERISKDLIKSEEVMHRIFTF